MQIDTTTMFAEYPDAVDIKTLTKMLNGISRQFAYKLIKDGQIAAKKVGREYIIAKVHVIKFLLGE